ncbi:hypothetical protein LJR034_008698 [Caballeronia sp. LjRoot34]|jgi:hypothetical protein|uniref:hypothetical protein n=1 Tax=Caballeronia sp. LjRoot34 TaxID=3342325 RepID=UPI003ED0F2EC
MNNQQFQFGNVSYLDEHSREVGIQSTVRVGIKSVFTSCNCGHYWLAQTGAGLASVIGGVIIACPECKVSAKVSGSELEA